MVNQFSNNIQDCVLLIDKGYYKLQRFVEFDKKNITFVIPLKKNIKYKILEETIFECQISNVIVQKIQLSNKMIVKKVQIDNFQLITNDLDIKWYEIVNLYSFRWEIELLFKKLKSNWGLNKYFFRNKNSIMSFISINIIAFILLEYFARLIKISLKEVNLELSRHIEGLLTTNMFFEATT